MRDEHSSANGITTFEFFSRFPSLHGFFFEALKEATADLQQQEQGELDVLSGSQRIHPGLQPVLVLLSRLQAPPSEIPNDPLAIGGFFPLISLCSRLRQYHGRTMAARALLSTIPGDRVDRCFRSLLETIPSDPSKCLKALGHNGVHGVLLQVQSSLNSYVSIVCPNVSCHSWHRSLEHIRLKSRSDQIMLSLSLSMTLGIFAPAVSLIVHLLELRSWSYALHSRTCSK